ncbi:MAG: hypothetical protein HY287_00455 [Planctomycetes bacterium]|nr:hypothetical protein [Planctomycetota bacterium]
MLQGDLAILGLILFVGCVAFIFGAIYLMTNVFASVFRGVSSALFPNQVPQRTIFGCCGRSGKTCRRPGCGKIERRPAKFCSQCGGKLG